MTDNKEKILLPIISIAIAVTPLIFILFSQTLLLIPIASIIAVSLSYLALFINRKNKKIMTYISSGISVFVMCVILVVGTISFYAIKSSVDSMKDLNKSMSQSKEEFKWTKKDYDSIKIGQKVKLEELITKFGEPTDTQDSEYSFTENKTVAWNVTGIPYTSVSLSLENEDNKGWVVTSKNQTGLRENLWKGYNKLDTKLRENVERFIMARRKFDKQFKNSAVKLILEEGYSVKEVSHELDVHANSLYRWVQEVEEYGENAFPGNGTALADAQHKIKLLEKENRYLQEELELLKKFRVFLKRNK